MNATKKQHESMKYRLMNHLYDISWRSVINFVLPFWIIWAKKQMYRFVIIELPQVAGNQFQLHVHVDRKEAKSKGKKNKLVMKKKNQQDQFNSVELLISTCTYRFANGSVF